MNAQKIGGLIVLLIGVPLGILAPDRLLLSASASIGLMMIFYARERINDERVQQLKMKAMFTAMSVGIAGVPVAHHYLFVLLRFNAGTVSPIMSCYEFLAGVLLIALGLYHYWRWRDARPESGA